MSKKTPLQKTLLALEQDECRWPIGDPKEADFHFCGAHKVAGRPYCQAHWQMAFQPSGSRVAKPAFAAPVRRAA
jgi:GcrA cell cycle regulator